MSLNYISAICSHNSCEKVVYEVYEWCEEEVKIITWIRQCSIYSLVAKRRWENFLYVYREIQPKPKSSLLLNWRSNSSSRCSSLFPF